MDAKGKLLLCIVLGSFALLVLGLIYVDMDKKLTESKLEAFNCKPDNAKPIWCDEFNTCYIKDTWMKVTNTSNTDPYHFVVSKGFSVEKVTIEEIQFE